jgi:cytochrome c oxidase subunit II
MRALPSAGPILPAVVGAPSGERLHVGPNLTTRSARGARPTRSFVSRRAGAVATVLVGLVALSGCSAQTVEQWKRLGLPEPANSSAPDMEALWIGAWIAAFIVGFFVWGLIIWASVRYRRRSADEIPTQVRYNLPIEVLYTVAPFVIIFVLFYHTVLTQQEVLADEAPDSEKILVVGQQWSWSFNYLGEDGQDAPNATNGNDAFEVGTVADFPTLYLPVGKQVKFILRSQDVIHSFWIPSFYFKLDIVPGRTNEWVTTPTREGTYAGKCAELCGLEHARMLFNVKVVSQAEYDRHVQALRAQGNRGSVLGNSDTDRIDGLESEGQTGAGE